MDKSRAWDLFEYIRLIVTFFSGVFVGGIIVFLSIFAFDYIKEKEIVKILYNGHKLAGDSNSKKWYIGTWSVLTEFGELSYCIIDDARILGKEGDHGYVYGTYYVDDENILHAKFEGESIVTYMTLDDNNCRIDIGNGVYMKKVN